MKLLSLFRRSSAVRNSLHPEMTWASKSLGTAVSRTGVFLRKQIWIWPIVATVLLGTIGLFVSHAISTTMRANMQSQLESLLSVESEMLHNWIRTNIANATATANNQAIRDSIHQLIEHEESAGSNSATAGTEIQELRRALKKQLGPTLSSHDYAGYIVAGKSGKVIAAATEELIGREVIPEFEELFQKALKGKASVTPPFGSVVMLKDETGRLRSGVPTMLVCAPVRDVDFEVVGVLALRIRPELEFTRILQLGQFGNSGETYAFDKSGLMVSNSRFDEDLFLSGILPDREGARSILNVQLRDPGGNMMDGYRPAMRRSQQPLTKSVASAVSGADGVDIDGYRDYRGVWTLGAWKWFPEFEMGVVTEVDRDEAYRPLTILQWTFRSLLVLLATSSVAIFLFTLRVARLQREAQLAAIELKHLGQYELEEKLGSGGMGVVFKGHHAMLRRPAAIKLLNVDKVNDASIHRFEREVQITCKLNHPNTIAIYDYGRTPEGVFYYAMEYLDGIDLQALVEKYGPQPEARVVNILRQICGSLYEAHLQGLVHRDIKPANVMLNRRGAETDVVKVLDFGLVKAVDDTKQAAMTMANSLTGTPLYMAPEAIQSPGSVDARSDLYAVGALGYFLLTGQPVFEAETLIQLCQMHIDAVPIPPSKRTKQAVSPELEATLLKCLDKVRTRRPHTARDLAHLLLQVPTRGEWAEATAEAWWNNHEAGTVPVISTNPGPADSPYSHTIVEHV